MLQTDFKDHNIENFTPKEITDTGADLKDVQLNTMLSLQAFRTYIRRRIGLIYNGMTTGNHKAPGHPNGHAVDCFLYSEDGEVNIHNIFKGALNAGFKAIGIYYNQKQFSFHLEIGSNSRKDFAFWMGIKDAEKNINSWEWFSLLQDPTKIVL